MTPGPTDRHAKARPPRRPPWRWLLPGAVLLLPFLLAFLLIDGEPLVLEVPELTSQRAAEARNLASRLRSEVLLAQRQPERIVITEDELNALAAAARRAVPRVSARANITPLAMLGAVSLRVPSSPFGSYVNVLVELAPSTAGLDLSRLQVGSLTVPRRFARPAARLALDMLLGWGNGRVLLDMVGGVSLEAGRLSVGLRPMPDFALRMAEIRDRLRLAREDALRVASAEQVKAYYQQIEELAALTGPRDRISLARYMSPVFELAERRSRTGSAIEENRAAIMALAIYFGTPRFELFTGTVIPADPPASGRRGARTTLADRVDSRLHFVYSAALKLASDSGVSFALGEFKEMLDAGQGGSGFSFADLAADRAGIRFAEEAAASEARAARLQQRLAAGEDEGIFFPSLLGLPEDLSEARFRRAYVGLDSPEYQAALAEIDRRLDELPLYR